MKIPKFKDEQTKNYYYDAYAKVISALLHFRALFGSQSTVVLIKDFLKEEKNRAKDEKQRFDLIEKLLKD